MVGSISVDSRVNERRFSVELRFRPYRKCNQSGAGFGEPADDRNDTCFWGSTFLVAEDTDINAEIL